MELDITIPGIQTNPVADSLTRGENHKKDMVRMADSLD